MSKNKVLLIGWDAADWKLIGPLIARGLMPSLKGLIDRGVYGNMSTMNPPYSPMLWSSVATGKTPDKHGVLGFIEVTPDGTGLRPVTVNSRKVRAIWNILHNQGLKSNIIGWWPSFPAEPINGVIITDRFQKINANPKKKNPMIKGIVHPSSLASDLKDLRMFPYEITEAHIIPFMPNASKINQENDKGLQSFAKIMAENSSIHAAATNIIRTTDWDFMAVYYDLIDHFCHAFMKYHPPKLKQIPEDFYDIYKDNVVGAYRYQDMMLGRMLELAGKDTTIIVMSDHGYESGHNRILKMPKYPAAPSLEHRQFGIFVAAGPTIKKNEKVFGLGLIDVAPTILQMFGLPIGKDMDGKPALDIFRNPTKVNYIDSWDQATGDFGEHVSSEENTLSDAETMQQLIDLGYIEKPDEKIETAVHKTKCDIQHNLARVYLGKKDYTKAKLILLELIEESAPIDIVPFYMDLLSVSLQENDFENADTYLKKLRGLDKKFELNTSVSEAKILIGKKQPKKALLVLESARGKNPNAQIWFEIGKIHLQLGQFEESKLAFEASLDLEIDNAKTHQAMARAYHELKDYESAAEHALTSIELVKYFPDAHFVLGQALEKLGDLENAKIAFETASKLRPRVHHRAETAIEIIKERIEKPLLFKDKINFKYRKEQIVIVSGLPRSGTSLMMQMLHNGGIEVVTDGERESDFSNPRGYFEYKPVMSLHKDNTWLHLAKDKSLKVVAPLLKFLDPKYRYKVIFMNRDLTEIVKSQQKMIGKDPENLPIKLFETYKKNLYHVETWKDREPGVELIYVDYKDLLQNADVTLDKVISFLGVKMHKEAMKTCIDVSLYRNKA